MFWYTCVDGNPISVASGERSKVNLDLWDLFMVIVSLGHTYMYMYLVGIMMTGLISFQKSIF